MPSLHSARLVAGVLLIPLIVFGQQELRIQSDRAPAGGRAIIRIGLTEPDPILTGKFAFTYSGGPLRQIRGIGLFSDQYDVVGAARINGTGMSVRFASFNARAGAINELPVAVIAVDVDPAAQAGQASQLAINPNTTQLVGPNGQPYVTSIKPADFTVGGLSVTSAEPSEGMIQPGQTITLRGVGFDSEVDVSIEDVVLSSVQPVSAAEIRLIAGQEFRIEGKRIRVRNKKTGEQQYFYAFTPSTPLTTTRNAYLSTMVPVFNITRLSRGLLRSVASGGANITAIALTNPSPSPAQITIEVLNASQTVLGTNVFTLPAQSKSLHEVSELVAQASGITGGYLVARSTLPVGMLGMRGTTTEDTLTPVILEDDPLPGVTPSPTPTPTPTPNPTPSPNPTPTPNPTPSPNPTPTPAPTPNPTPPPAPNPNVPTIRSGGISLSANATAALAARALFSVYGSQFASAGTAVSASLSDVASGMAPVVLAETCVLVNGQPAPLNFVSAGQINGQVPSLTALGTVSVVVIRNCGTVLETRSEPQTVVVDSVSPGFFVLNQRTGAALLPVAALHGGGPAVAAEAVDVAGATPARPGEYISLFGTGFGAVRNGLQAGQIPELLGMANVDALRLTNSLTVVIGGIPVAPEDLYYAGAAPCCAGLDQIVVRVPLTLPSGKWEISASVLGRTTARGPYLSVLR